MQHEDKDGEVMAEEMLDAPPAWSEVPGLIIETKEGRVIPEAVTKSKRDEVACWWRKQRREDEIQPKNHDHSPMVIPRTWNPTGCCSED